MKPIVFAGPSVTRQERQDFPDFVWLPPAGQGDVFRCLSHRPSLIGIIDGYFDGTPAVWHKEILHAMSAGVTVFGGASMGALRAAELHSFGMRGVGKIFEAYRDGIFVDDDEVALMHGPAETGYVNLSVAMADIRAALGQAVAQDVIDQHAADGIAGVIKKLHFPERDWSAVRAAAMPISPRLADWIEHNKVSQKLEDARSLLTEMRNHAQLGEQGSAPSFHFETTELWNQGVEKFRSAAQTDPDILPVSDEWIMEELRLQCDLYKEIRDDVALTLLAGVQSSSAGDIQRSEEETQYRLDKQLFTAASFRQWLDDNQLSGERLADLLVQRRQLKDIVFRITAARPQAFLDELRFRGLHAVLARRARAKQRALGAAGLDDNPRPKDIGLLEQDLVEWFFANRLAQDAPEQLDRVLAELGFASKYIFLEAIMREYIYETRSQDSPVPE